MRLHQRFGSWRYALAAYNWGPSNVAEALNSGRQILPQSLRYADSVLRKAREYR